MNNFLKTLLLTASLMATPMQYAMDNNNEDELMGDQEKPEEINKEDLFLLCIYNDSVANYFNIFVSYGANDDDAWKRARYANEYIYDNSQARYGEPRITPYEKFLKAKKDKEFITLCNTIARFC